MTEVLTIPAVKNEPVRIPDAEINPLPSKEINKKPQPFIQTKLTVGAPDDPYEKEADAVADKVMRMPEKNFVQRKCAECEKEEKIYIKPSEESVTPFIQTKTNGESSVSDSLSSDIQNSRGGGSSLEEGTKSFMEYGIRSDFSSVKIHTGGEAASMNKELNAKAFTIGNDIYFNEGQYQPHTQEGKHLLAHELVHTVQQHNGQKRISCAWYDAGRGTNRVRINIDYGQVVYYLIHQWQQGVEDTFSRYTGQPGASIAPAITALTNPQKRWLLFAIDLLSDNEITGLDKLQAVIDLITYVPVAVYQPLAADFALHNFENEVLRVAGWYEKALTSRLQVPGQTVLDQLHILYNPTSSASSAGSSTCPATRAAGQQLDEPVLRNDLPPLVRTYLQGQAQLITGRGVRQQNISDVRSIADMVQQEALQFFSPYIGRASTRNYLPQWQYSAHLTSSTAGALPAELQHAFIDNRARREAGSSGLFSRVHYDSRCDADEIVFESILQQLLGEAAVQANLNTILSWQTFTQHDNASAEVTINLQSFQTNNECESRWKTINTLCHELMHVYVHQDFYDLHRERQLIKEGFTEVLGDQLYDEIRRRANNNSTYRAGFEIGLTAGVCTGISIPVSGLGYPPAGNDAESIRSMVGNDRFRAAYFLGQTDLIGLQPKLFVDNSNSPLEKEADAVADKVMRMPQQNFVQLKCTECEKEDIEKLNRKPEEHKKPFIQTKTDNNTPVVSDSLSQSIQSSKGSGTAMDESTKSFMSERIGADFSNVNIHADSKSAQMNSELSAKAFTVGSDIYFNEGQYQPHSDSGKHLLAHELTHTLQQSNIAHLQRIQRNTNSSSDVRVLYKPSKKNPVNDKKISFEYTADKELPFAVINMPDHPLMIWAVSKVFGIDESSAAHVVTSGGFIWNDSGGRTKNYTPGEKVRFTLPASGIGEWIKVLADDGLISRDVQAIFEEVMNLQESLSDRDYSFFMDWAKDNGVVFTGNIMDFKNLTPDSLDKLKGLIAEFNEKKYEILYYRGKVKEYYLTEDLQRDTEFEKLKDRFYNKKISDLSEADRELILKLFKDRALSFAFVSLEESKIIAQNEFAKYKSDPKLLDEIAAIVTGQSDTFLKNVGARITEFKKFDEKFYGLISDLYRSGANRVYIYEPANVTAYSKMRDFSFKYEQLSNDLPRLFEFTKRKDEIISFFRAGAFEKELADNLFHLLHIPYVHINKEQRKREYVPESVDNSLFLKFRQLFPEGAKPTEEEVKRGCLGIVYSEIPAIASLNESDKGALSKMLTDAASKNHLIIKDASLDFRTMAMNGISGAKENIIDVLEEKPVKAAKTQSKLAEDSSLIWEFQPLLYYILQQENLEKGHPVYDVVDNKIKAVADRSFWESLGLAALGLILGIAGIFTGGTTTVLGAALLAGAATVSLIDFSREYDQYVTQSDAYNSTFNIPFVNEPSMLGVILSLGGLVLDVGDVLKVFGKAAKAGAKAADPAMEALAQSKNIDEYSGQLFEILNSKKLVREGVTKDVFVKTIKANWEQTAELTKNLPRYEEIIKALPADVQKLIADSGFSKMAIEIKGSVFRIYDYSRDAFSQVIRFLGNSADKLKLLGLQIFKKNILADAYGQLSQVLSAAHYEKIVKYFTGIGYNAADNLPEILHLMNKGDLFKYPELATQVLTNRQLQQMLFGFHTNPAHMAVIWGEFVTKNGNDAGDIIKYIETNTPYGGHLKLQEASQPLPKLSVPETNKGVLTDINGKPPKATALQGLGEDMDKLIKKADNTENIVQVTDPKYVNDYDAEVFVDPHTFRRNKQTGRWCRFSNEVCNVETPVALNVKVDEALAAKTGETISLTGKVPISDKPVEAGEVFLYQPWGRKRKYRAEVTGIKDGMVEYKFYKVNETGSVRLDVYEKWAKEGKLIRVDAVRDFLMKNRPKYEEGLVEKVWNAAKKPDGRVFDPNPPYEELFWDTSKGRFEQWHMGHRTGYEYRKLVDQYVNGEISFDELLKEYNNAGNYFPELPSKNLSHEFEAE